MNYNKRIKKLQKKIRRKKLDGLLISQPENRRYLCGYKGGDNGIAESSGFLVVPASGEVHLMTDFRFVEQAKEETGKTQRLHVHEYPRGITALLEEMLPDLGISRLGFESSYTLHSFVQNLSETLDKMHVSLHPTEGMVEKLRLIKDADEIKLIKKSVRLNEKVFQKIFVTFADYKTEADVALAIESEMRRAGAEKPSFETIVASGANGARPHAIPSFDAIDDKASLTIDMGLVLNGYCSDMTRNFVPGKASKKYLKLHRIVRRAQLAGIASIRPGITGAQADKAARDIIADAGYDKYFGHSLGHGVGLAVHEAPGLSTGSRKKLKPGMVVTVEPGIYIPGWGGIRLENMVVVTEDGCESLNSDTTWLDI